jgi:uncharacterized protein YdhG (YjbR/CyaY superfamily)
MDMNTKQITPKTMDQYIADFPQDVQKILQEIRRTVIKAAPDAMETIKYGMPTFTLKGNLVYFGAFKRPISSGSVKFRKELAAYEGSKRSLIFPLDKPIPFDLIHQVVELRVKENLERSNETSKKK